MSSCIDRSVSTSGISNSGIGFVALQAASYAARCAGTDKTSYATNGLEPFGRFGISIVPVGITL
jgi:hypothetical protein